MTEVRMTEFLCLHFFMLSIDRNCIKDGIIETNDGKKYDWYKMLERYNELTLDFIKDYALNSDSKE